MEKSIAFCILAAFSISLLIQIKSKNQPDTFNQWKHQFGNNMDRDEAPYRLLIFEKNLRKIQLHNSDTKSTYKMGINQFSIYTDEEFVARFLMDINISVPQINEIIHSKTKSVTLEQAIDWTTLGKVSRVKNQGQCASCWAFSTTGVLQSHALINNQKYDFSQQQLVDCSQSYGNFGCNGGIALYAMKYISDFGIANTSQYPYVARNQRCMMNGGNFKIKSFESPKGCSGLLNDIKIKPISIMADASNWALYKSGVFNSCRAIVNHCGLLVGIDEIGNWKVKNSWGIAWGEGGFIRLAAGNTCGICISGGIYPS